MRENLFEAIAGLSGIRSRKYAGVLVVSAIVTAVSVWFAVQNRINGDVSAMAPDDAPSVRNLREIEKRFGATNTLVVLLLAPVGEDMSGKLDLVAADLARSPYVKRVDYRMDTRFFEDRGLYYLTPKELLDLKEKIQKRIREETIKSSPFYVDLDEEDDEEEKAAPIDSSDVAGRFEGSSYVVGGFFRKVVDGGRREAWALIVTPSRGAADVNYARALIRDISARIDSLHLGQEIEVLMSGRCYYLASEGDQIMSDVKRISFISSIGVLAAVFFFFPNVFIIFLIFIPLLLGLAVDFAIVKLTIGELNVVTSGNFAILFGMGVAYGVHVYARFREERKLGHLYEDSMERSVGDTGKAVLLSAATTAGAFFMLMTANYKGFSQIGFITGLGVIFTFLTALVVMPAVGKPLSAWNLLRKHRYLGTPAQDLVKRWGEAPPLTVTLTLVGVLVTAASVVALPRIRYEMDYNNLSIKDEMRNRARHYEQELFGMSGEAAVTYANGEEELRTLMDHLWKLKEGEGKNHIEKVVSILSFIPKGQEEKSKLIEDLGRVVGDKKLNLARGEERENIEKIRRMTRARPFGVRDVPADVRQRFEGKDEGYLAYIYPRRDITDLSEAIKVRELLTGMKIGRRSASATNTTIVFAEMQAVMLRDAPVVITLSFLVVVLCLLVVFRSLKDSLLSIIPLVIGISWMLGIMAVTGQTINYFNIIAIPAVIGIGVDSGVHIVHRYRVEGIASLRRVVRNLSRTLLVSNLTTIFGFGALLFSRHPGIRSLGLAAAIGLATTFLASVFFLPSVIYVQARVAARRLLGRRPEVAVWTMAFDPMTECIKLKLRERGVDFAIISLDEMPQAERGIAVRFLRSKAGGDLYLPVVEVGGKVRCTGRMSPLEACEAIDEMRGARIPDLTISGNGGK